MGAAAQYVCYKMKLLAIFKPKVFLAMPAVCVALGAVAAWGTGMSFWVPATIYARRLRLSVCCIPGSGDFHF